MAEYDSIAQSYQESRKVVLSLPETYTYLSLIGDISGQTILELGCGEGFYTRKLKQKGASRVIGIDLSEQMVELAREQEAREPLGVEYMVCDVLELGKIGEFDIVTATYLLNHAQTKEQLFKMCQSIVCNLKSGGRFIAINNNLELSPEFYPLSEKYGRRQSIAGGILKEGSPITVTLFDSVNQATFVDFYLGRPTYEWAFEQAGLKEVIWHPLRVSPEDIEKFGQPFWQDLIDYSNLIVIEGVKK